MMNTNSNINKSQRLFIEMGTSLLLKSQEAEHTVSCELIGMQVGSYLIIRISADNTIEGGRQKDKGEELTVKFICSGDIFAFKSRIIRKINEPDCLIFLEYPDIVESCSTRSHGRVTCFLPVQVILGEATVNATVVNITFKGCLCLIDNSSGLSPMKQDKLIVNFFDGRKNLLSLEGEIRSIQKHSLNISLGICFTEVDDFTESILGALVPGLIL